MVAILGDTVKGVVFGPLYIPGCHGLSILAKQWQIGYHTLQVLTRFGLESHWLVFSGILGALMWAFLNFWYPSPPCTASKLCTLSLRTWKSLPGNHGICFQCNLRNTLQKNVGTSLQPILDGWWNVGDWAHSRHLYRIIPPIRASPHRKAATQPINQPLWTIRLINYFKIFE